MTETLTKLQKQSCKKEVMVYDAMIYLTTLLQGGY